MAFGALPPELHVGDIIKWVNEDILVHTATARDGSFDVMIKPKAFGFATLLAVGEIPFYCRYHPGMTGTLVVRKYL